MAKSCKGQRRVAARKYGSSPYYKPSCEHFLLERQCPKGLDERDWKDAICSVCMESPHNAVLLLCSSHDHGCRPYMCGTNIHYSNCLDQYVKAHTNSHTVDDASGDIVEPVTTWSIEKDVAAELTCPLCRGKVKGWTLVDPARAYLNAMRRSCVLDACSYVGTYKELRRHVKAKHPSARPREVDPVIVQKWKTLEREQERDDVISMLTSFIPRSIVFEDYVINESSYNLNFEHGDLEAGFGSITGNLFHLLHAIGRGRRAPFSMTDMGSAMMPEGESHDGEEWGEEISRVPG